MDNPDAGEICNEAKSGGKLWSKNIIILWQGQLISAFGDSVYNIALGFWVLQKTGSTMLMATIMAVSAIPGLIVSPFAGVVVDRQNKKILVILMDSIRGVSILLVAAAAYFNMLAIWMVIVAGILINVCGAIFRPAINSALPDMVDKNKVMNANAFFSIGSTASTTLGYLIGGVLFQLLGASVMFLCNGLSYLISVFSIIFVEIKSNKRQSESHFLADMKGGIDFVCRAKGLWQTFFIISIFNFFFYIVIVLFMPLFQKSPELGVAKYGIAMGCFMGGSMLGYAFTTACTIVHGKRWIIYEISITLFCILLCFVPFITVFPVMSVLLFFGGSLNSVINVMLVSTVQIASPLAVRGKVLALMSMVTQSLSPFAQICGGLLSNVFPIRLIMSCSFVFVLFSTLPIGLNKNFKKFITTDYTK